MPNETVSKEFKQYKPYGEEWEQIADNIARSYAPHIYPCIHCGYPVVKGYCCSNCGSQNPSSK